ncbi:MAG: tetratricopeptide repeat protein [Bacteroidota bacterium]|nr:tetratricopeptide repeat protein [Bacteroidota bacterium]
MTEENNEEIFEEDIPQEDKPKNQKKLNNLEDSFEEEFTPSGNVLVDFYRKNKNIATIALLTFLIVLGGSWYYFARWVPEKNKEAENALFYTEDYFARDSMNLVLNGDGIHPGALEIIEDYGNTNAGNKARYMAGIAYLNTGQYQEATKMFSKTTFRDKYLGSMVSILLGDSYAELGEIAKAGKYYMKAFKNSDNVMTAPYALQKAAIAFEKIEAYQKAIDAYQILLDDFSDSEFAQNAEVSIHSLQSKISR